MQALINAVAEKHNGVISNGSVKFTHDESEFFVDAGVIYRNPNWKLPPRFKRVSTMAAVDRFVDLRK